jgi:molybdenum cofactor cytidylyltransferase
MSQDMVGIVILAAGGSTKLGSPKQLVRFQGKTLFLRSVESALMCGLGPIVVVLGANADLIKAEVDGLPIHVIINQDWEIGISSSIRVGLAKMLDLRAEVDAVVIMLSDQPFVDEKTILSLFEVYNTSDRPIVASEYDGVLGVPALFDREMFDELMALEGDAGARVIIRQNSAEKVATISAPEAAFDVDTLQDRDRLRDFETQTKQVLE